MSFVAQLEKVPDCYKEWERKAFKKLSPGPSSWAKPEVFKSLKVNFKMPQEAKDLREVAVASKIRLALTEKWKGGGLKMKQRRGTLRKWRMEEEPDCLGDQANVRWATWYERAHAENVYGAVEEVSKEGIKLAEVVTAVRAREGNSKKTVRSDGKPCGVQAEVYKRLKKERGNPRRILGRWLKRWKIGLWEEVKVERAMRTIDRLGKLVPPRVIAAVLRTWANGWCTTRRYQVESECIFGCPWRGTDCIEHYLVCPKIEKWNGGFMGRIREGSAKDRSQRALLLGGQFVSDEELTLDALRLAALYDTHNKCRHGKGNRRGERVSMLTQSIMDRAEGHVGAMRALHRRQLITCK